MNNTENAIKYNKNSNEDLFNQLSEIKLINGNINIDVTSKDFEIFKNLYNKLKSSHSKLEKLNIIEQFYSEVTNTNKLFSIFNDILLRNDKVLKLFNDLLHECLNIQLQYSNVVYGGVNLIHQTILNTINKHFINNFYSEIEYWHSKQYNKENFENNYNNFFNKIFYSVSNSNTTKNMENYLNCIVINKLNEAICDVERYRETFSKSDHSNGYKFFDNLHKFLKNNLDNITNYPVK